ncbi:hypothetical protein BS78_08G002300 [Paspalum vaginatum]|nr:hypothetical protein BS78_08G002300 [Paspalum vaginatum]KAJ1264454.1 hypothetical protein BS78_08G002300 [Paspalum vaginatum]KAJ1264458.1 hypothetical protein BS78_08G002300 [Paspalum vaginatum]
MLVYRGPLRCLISLSTPRKDGVLPFPFCLDHFAFPHLRRPSPPSGHRPLARAQPPASSPAAMAWIRLEEPPAARGHGGAGREEAGEEAGRPRDVLRPAALSTAAGRTPRVPLLHGAVSPATCRRRRPTSSLTSRSPTISYISTMVADLLRLSIFFCRLVCRCPLLTCLLLF